MFLITRKAVPLLKRNLEGTVINMSSAAGRFGYPFRTPYAAAKWGVIGFTQSLAKELGPAGIRVNAILPGIVEGPRMENVIRARAEETGVSFSEMERQYLERTSMRRMVSADDVAGMVLFLCSPLGRNISASRSACAPTSKACEEAMSEKVTIVGSGLVGRGWAIAFARGGWDVVLWDPVEGAAAKSLELATTSPLTCKPQSCCWARMPAPWSRASPLSTIWPQRWMRFLDAGERTESWT